MTLTEMAGIYGAVMSTAVLGVKVALEVREYRKRKRWARSLAANVQQGQLGLQADALGRAQFEATRGLGGIYGGKKP